MRLRAMALRDEARNPSKRMKHVLPMLKRQFPYRPEPSRPIVTRAPHRPVGRFASDKMHGPLEWESFLEWDNFRILETDNYVKEYHPQPPPIDYPLDGRTHSYTADALVHRRDGRRVYVEVKYEVDAKRSDNVAKFKAIKSECRRLGAEFHVATEKEIRRQPRLSNAKQLLRYRRVEPKGRLELDVMEAVTTQRLVTVRDLMVAIRLPDSRLGELYALALRGDINIDLETAPLSPDSKVFRPYA